MARKNALGQEIGDPLPGWTARALPPRTPMVGRFCTVEPLDPARHADALVASFAEDKEGRCYTYMSYGPFASADAHRAWIAESAASKDPMFHAILANGKAVGVASFLRIDPANGVIEVGHLNFSPQLQRTPAATEAMALMMKRTFVELGYRRYEWKCDSLNAPSRAAALRLGFTYEGLFRQAIVVKERNRDTAWFAILDSEYPAIASGFERWLDPANFDAAGRQRQSLAALRL